MLGDSLPACRLSDVSSNPARLDKLAYTKDELLKLWEESDGETDTIRRQLNNGHVAGLWGLAADVKTGLVDVEDVKRFQKGEWAEEVVKGRKSRLPGKGMFCLSREGDRSLCRLRVWQ